MKLGTEYRPGATENIGEVRLVLAEEVDSKIFNDGETLLKIILSRVPHAVQPKQIVRTYNRFVPSILCWYSSIT